MRAAIEAQSASMPMVVKLFDETAHHPSNEMIRIEKT
jgi:hypothetical protein